MKEKISRFAFKHRVFIAYLGSVAWLAFAALSYALVSGKNEITSVVIVCFFSVVTFVYFGFMRVFPKQNLLYSASEKSPRGRLEGSRIYLFYILLALYVAVIAAHFLYIGRLPVLEALKEKNDISISIVRQQSYFDLPSYLRYASDYSLKALGPALLVIAYYYRSYLFFIVLIAGGFYCLSLFARVFPILLFLPTLALQFTQRKWLHFSSTLSLMAILVFAVTTVASISFRGESVNVDQPGYHIEERLVSEYWKKHAVVSSLIERAILVPGQVIGQWFNYYEREGVFEAGCGYRPVALIVGCEYVHVPTKLYSSYYPENVKQGMHGSLNAAAFMTDYANFGLAGFAIAAVLCGLLFSMSYFIYGDHLLALPFNLPLILVLMESNFFTAINSGSGWLVMTAIFFLFFRLRYK